MVIAQKLVPPMLVRLIINTNRNQYVYGPQQKLGVNDTNSIFIIDAQRKGQDIPRKIKSWTSS